jgi:hypothetical protein
MDGLHPGKTIFIFLNVMGVGWWRVLKENFLIAICWHETNYCIGTSYVM